MRTARDFVTTNCPSNPTTHAEIGARYAEQHRKALKKRGPPPMGLLRINELEKIFTDRWGEHDLPNSPEGRDAIAILCNHCALLKDLGRLYAFVAARAWWMREDELAAIIERESANAPGDAAGLGWRLGLTMEERNRLRIRTIRAIGMTDSQIKKLRKDAGRERSARARRADGATPRDESFSRTEPWKAFGVSRRTWERRGKPIPDAAANGVVANSCAVPFLISQRTHLRQQERPCDGEGPFCLPSTPIEHGRPALAEAEGKPASTCEHLERPLAPASRPSGTAVPIDVHAVDAEARAFLARCGRAPTVDECLAMIDAGVGRQAPLFAASRQTRGSRSPATNSLHTPLEAAP
jgi:hypothetical protein